MGGDWWSSSVQSEMNNGDCALFWFISELPPGDDWHTDDGLHGWNGERGACSVLRPALLSALSRRRHPVRCRRCCDDLAKQGASASPPKPTSTPFPVPPSVPYILCVLWRIWGWLSVFSGRNSELPGGHCWLCSPSRQVTETSCSGNWHMSKILLCLSHRTKLPEEISLAF